MTDWYCHRCPANGNKSCGPWGDDSSLFPKIRQFHQNHPGWKQGIPEPTIEELGRNWWQEHGDQILHNVIAECKQHKVCLLKDKWRYLSQA